MGFKVNVSDMLAALERADHPRFEAHKRAAEALASLMAEDMGAALGVVVSEAEYDDPGFGGLLVGVTPAFRGQVLPDALVGADDLEVWLEDGGAAPASEASAGTPGRSFILADGAFFRVWKHKPIGLEIERKSDGATAFFQGDSAAELEDALEAAHRAHETGILAADPADHVCGEYEHILKREESAA